jgi:thiamine biosynthesis protein ThiS
MIKIKVNGKDKEIEENLSISVLLKKLNIDISTVFIALNQTIVKKDNLDKTILKEADSLEIIRIVAGG